MAKKAQDQRNFEDKQDAEDRLLALIKQVPTDAFVSMASRSGLPTKESRELCLAFKALKG